jgi:hypothetical protein
MVEERGETTMGGRMSKTTGRLSQSKKTVSVQTVPVRKSSADWLFSRRTARSPKAAGIRFVSRRRFARDRADSTGSRP